MPVKIFFCYAHEDEQLLNKLETHLRPLQRQGLIDLWYDRDITAGTEWEQEIKEQLNTADIILLLVSPDFIGSDYCYGTEMKRAIERHERGETWVIPIILRPVYWQGVLGKLQALPTDGKPVTGSSWHSLDEAFFDVAESVLKAINELENKELENKGRQETSEEKQLGSASSSQPTDQDAYTQFWSRRNRGLLVLLLDQSGSMQEQVKVGDRTYTNAQIAAALLNEFIRSAIHSTPVDHNTGNLKDYFDILILGYGDQVIPLVHDGQERPISLRELAMQPKGYERVGVEIYNRKGSIQQAKESLPLWITYKAISSFTQMALALQHTYQAIQKWLAEDKQHNRSFPPIVVNITNGQHNGTGDPVVEANCIHSLATDDGNVLLFNCYLASHGQQPILFPKSKDFILNSTMNRFEREWAIQLFQMSSILPRRMVASARNSFGLSLEDGARGFLYNASPVDLMNFLSWGTRPN